MPPNGNAHARQPTMPNRDAGTEDEQRRYPKQQDMREEESRGGPGEQIRKPAATSVPTGNSQTACRQKPPPGNRQERRTYSLPLFNRFRVQQTDC